MAIHAQTNCKLTTKPAKTSLLGGHFIYRVDTAQGTLTPSSANIVQNASVNGQDVTNQPSQWGYNTHIGANGIKLRYNELDLSQWTNTGLTFYNPSTTSQGNVAMTLDSSNLTFYGSDGITPQAVFGGTGAQVKGAITATSLTIDSDGTTYDGMAAINISGYDIEITSDSTGIANPDTSIYLYPHLYHNGVEIEYLLSVDTEVDNSKTYYTRSGTAGNYTYTIVSNPTGNPNTNQYYEHIDYSNFVWYQDDVEPGTAGDANNQGRYLATYGHSYRVTYDFDDGAVSGGTQVQTRTIDPSKYITKINDTGITIHPEVWTNQSSYIQLTGSGMELFNSNGNSIAQYGSTARVGLSNSSRFLINNNSLQAYDNNNNKYFEVNSNGLSWGNNTAATIADVEDAAATATNYISYIDSTNGIRIYDGRSENEDVNFAQINSNGMQIYQGGTANSNKVAEFGASGAQIGQNGSTRTEIGSNKTEWYMNNDRLAGALYYSPTESSNSQIKSGTITRPDGIDYWPHNLLVSDEGILEVSASGNITYNLYNPEAIGTFDFDEYITLEEYETHIWGGTYNISYVGDGTTKSFSLANVKNFAGSIESIFVGATMVTNYTLNETTITFDTAPASGTSITIYPNQYYYFKTYEISITLSSETAVIFYVTIEKDNPVIYCGFSEKTPIEGISPTAVEVEMSYTSELKYFFTITGEKVLFGQSSTDDIIASSTNIHNTLRVGNYSVVNKVDQPPFVIGNGTSDDARSNALMVDWNGDVTLKGHSTPIGTIYENTLSKTISNTGIDQNTDGASITIPTGVYVVIGQWTFNTRSTSGTTNSAIRMYRSGDNYANNIAQTRILGADGNWNALQCSCIVNVTNATETIKICGATSRPYTTSTATWIKAVRIV